MLRDVRQTARHHVPRDFSSSHIIKREPRRRFARHRQRDVDEPRHLVRRELDRSQLLDG